jgi:hypothetical protein
MARARRARGGQTRPPAARERIETEDGGGDGEDDQKEGERPQHDDLVMLRGWTL